MTTFHIPSTVEGALSELTKTGRLLTATEWERAAIVSALVGPAPGQGSRSDLGSSTEVLTPESLAAHKIIGLRSDKTIRRYRDAWADSGRPFPSLDEDVSLDGLPEWKSPDSRSNAEAERPSGGFRATKAEIRSRAARDPEFVRDVVEHAAPEVQREVRRQAPVPVPSPEQELEAAGFRQREEAAQGSPTFKSTARTALYADFAREALHLRRLAEQTVDLIGPEQAGAVREDVRMLRQYLDLIEEHLDHGVTLDEGLAALLRGDH